MNFKSPGSNKVSPLSEVNNETQQSPNSIYHPDDDDHEYDSVTPVRPSIEHLLSPSLSTIDASEKSNKIGHDDKTRVKTNYPVEKASQTDWWLTDAPKLEHGLRRTFNASSTYSALDRLRRTRSEVEAEIRLRLEDIQDSLDKDKLFTIRRTIVIAAVALLGSAFVYFLHLLIVTNAVSTREYLDYYMDNHTGIFFLTLLGIFHPAVIGSYCLYAVKYLHDIRPYYWKASISLIIPLILLIVFCIILIHIERDLESDMNNWLFELSHSPFSNLPRKIWDSTQIGLSCCGLHGPNDWNSILPKLPHSCCRKIGTGDCPSDHWKEGCLKKLKIDQNVYISVYIIIILLQVIFQVITIVAMRIYYKMIRQYIPFEPPIIVIIAGPCSIICNTCNTSEDPTTIIPSSSDAEEDTHELEHDLLPRDKYGDFVVKKPFPWVP